MPATGSRAYRRHGVRYTRHGPGLGPAGFGTIATDVPIEDVPDAGPGRDVDTLAPSTRSPPDRVRRRSGFERRSASTRVGQVPSSLCHPTIATSSRPEGGRSESPPVQTVLPAFARHSRRVDAKHVEAGSRGLTARYVHMHVRSRSDGVLAFPQRSHSIRPIGPIPTSSDAPFAQDQPYLATVRFVRCVERHVRAEYPVVSARVRPPAVRSFVLVPGKGSSRTHRRPAVRRRHRGRFRRGFSSTGPDRYRTASGPGGKRGDRSRSGVLPGHSERHSWPQWGVPREHIDFPPV